MRVKDILNADMTTVQRWLREGLAWWISELAELLPRNWHDQLLRREKLRVRFNGEDLVREDAPEKEVRGAAELVLPPSAALTREIELPILPLADMRRMIALDIDRLAPFRPGAALFDIAIEERDAEQGRQRLRLAVMTRATLEGAIERARAVGVRLTAVRIAGEGGPRFDFLRAYQQAGAARPARRASMWWAGAGALAAANILVLVYRDETSLQSLRDAVEFATDHGCRCRTVAPQGGRGIGAPRRRDERSAGIAARRARRAYPGAAANRLGAPTRLERQDRAPERLPERAGEPAAPGRGFACAGPCPRADGTLAGRRRGPQLRHRRRCRARGEAMRPLNARERRFVAVGILVGLIAVVWLAILAPLIGGFLDRADEREALTDRYERNERVLAGVPIWRALAREQARTAARYALLAPTEELAAEALKERIGALAQGRPGAVRAIQEIDEGVRPGWVRVRADLELTLDQLYAGLKRLESGEPHVVVESLSIAADRAMETGQLSPMVVRIEVAAPFRAAAGH